MSDIRHNDFLKLNSHSKCRMDPRNQSCSKIQLNQINQTVFLLKIIPSHFYSLSESRTSRNSIEIITSLGFTQGLLATRSQYFYQMKSNPHPLRTTPRSYLEESLSVHWPWSFKNVTNWSVQGIFLGEVDNRPSTIDGYCIAYPHCSLRPQILSFPFFSPRS